MCFGGKLHNCSENACHFSPNIMPMNFLVKQPYKKAFLEIFAPDLISASLA